MNDALSIGMALGIAAVALVVQLFARAWLDERSKLRRRLGIGSGPARAELVGEVFGRFGRAVRDVDLGFGPRWALAIGLACAVAGGLALGVLAMAAWAVLAGSVIGLTIPAGVLIFLGGRRLRRLREDLPDALSAMARSIRAGLSLEQALELASHDGGGTLAEEFGRCADQVRVGLPVAESFRLAARRTGLVDLDLLASVTSLQQAIGGNLPQLLERMASGTRDRNQFLGQVRAQTGMARTSAVMIAAGQPLLLAAYAASQPEFLRQFFETDSGRAAFGVSIALELIGLVWIALLLRVDS